MTHAAKGAWAPETGGATKTWHANRYGVFGSGGAAGGGGSATPAPVKAPGYQPGEHDDLKDWDLGKFDDFDFAQPKNTGLMAMMDRQGFLGRPTIVSRAEADVLVKDGGVRITRGFTDSPGGTAAQHKAQFMSEAEPFIGRGVFGCGTYFSTSKAEAVGYSRGSSEHLVEGVLHPGAKVIDFDKLHAMTKNDPQVKAAIAANPGGAIDVSRIAVAKGYDAIRTTTDQFTTGADGQFIKTAVPQYTILNRTAVYAIDDEKA